MIYSVWNTAVEKYDYYEDGRSADTVNAPAPKHIPRATMGAAPDQAAWPLPAGVRLVGRGDFAKGRIAVNKAAVGLGAVDFDRNTVGILGLGVAAVLLWKHLR